MAKQHNAHFFKVGLADHMLVNDRDKHLKKHLPLRKQPPLQSFAVSPNQQCIGEAVAILLCTYNGEKYLSEQLDSIANQTYKNWTIYVSDDGSNDNTLQILERYRAEIGKHRLHIFEGPKEGFAKNFLSLIKRKEIEAAYFAFSDQDDIWLKDKLERSVVQIKIFPSNTPILYCSRTLIFSDSRKISTKSPLFKFPPSFENSLVQSLAGGNTMMINNRSRELLKKIDDKHKIISHDWIAYLIVSGCGGTVIYDPEPTLLYRQHEANLIGGNMGFGDRLTRLQNALKGSFIEWNDYNLLIINSLKNQLTEKNRLTLKQFEEARHSNLLKRVFLIKSSGVYRQTVAGNISLLIATILKKI
ncbi:glycosyltransferase family 2 protein [Pseudomonas sp. N-137]|uniref:glycosyltransferase family 2 protein n=1 Tax=Pseudomonas sp. N-137 TaxID=3108452 RepID=UPI002ADEF0BD|nr:glycosyltransferase family 2 protein [Pseudomonas sp. N-137]MEA1031771.1 glycosyltransferase family 2 protein [Pseudomonas sp. N-137]